jgi:hypothetical protein
MNMYEVAPNDPVMILAAHAHVNNHFFSGAPEERQGYDSRGLVNTNNLPLFFMDEPFTQTTPGFPNLYDYNQREFKDIFIQLKNDRPDLWEQGVHAQTERTTSLDDQMDALFSSPGSDPAAVIALLAKADWERKALFTEIFDSLVPMLVQDGIDPLAICI